MCSFGAGLFAKHSFVTPWIGVVDSLFFCFGFFFQLSKHYPQADARSHKPQIKSRMSHGLRPLGAPVVVFLKEHCSLWLCSSVVHGHLGDFRLAAIMSSAV